MRGKKKTPVRAIAPDPKYGNTLLAKFINYLMQFGKKTTARSIVYEALETISKGGKEDPIKVFETAVNNIRPQVEVRSRRVGGANYQVPLPVRGTRQNALAFRWIIGAARNKKGAPMAERLATVLTDTFNNTGDAMKKRDDVHRMAEANKAFAHFARFAK
ncbi:MAG: 30S ribosomal protein S7 [Candidatus Magasanikbacteria bacterium RIFOXYC2_FULL_42_28]|uniref:Small ribosomal subunit protein uS7 n=1 Tax=Candidatus Magasanikbacteria bacterium RIFOXYC2_FULL_42_28 TaxID=1798704 RepID=A0A1F6NV14_9BACT|nr:MAG: 30S ribosomal protein S7 [Candidatus Magasanikbacteria bacterium RIFOXYC2_FULL_42_28]